MSNIEFWRNLSTNGRCQWKKYHFFLNFIYDKMIIFTGTHDCKAKVLLKTFHLLFKKVLFIIYK